MLYIVLFIIMPSGEGADPGTFFWQPRTGHDLVVPTIEKMRSIKIDYVKEGVARLLRAYQVGITIVGLAKGITDASKYPYLNPISAYYYTNVYRWAIRYFSLIPDWMGGAGNFSDTHKVWRRRFHYADQFVPQWLRKALVFVKKDEWKKEEIEFKRFRKFVEPAFGKHFGYPKEQTNETFTDDVSSSSMSFIN